MDILSNILSENMCRKFLFYVKKDKNGPKAKVSDDKYTYTCFRISGLQT